MRGLRRRWRFFLVLSALLAAYGVQRVLNGGRLLVWGVALGCALGLASATKLTGLVGIGLTIGCGAVLSLWLWWRLAETMSARRIAAWAAIAAAVALVLFVAVNPYLWRGPVVGLRG